MDQLFAFQYCIVVVEKLNFGVNRLKIEFKKISDNFFFPSSSQPIKFLYNRKRIHPQN
jgi:hypothetical protein